jgi:hypothetical protein
MKLTIYNEKLKIDLKDLQKVLAIRGGFKIPLEHIVKATTETPETSWREIRAPGTYLPGVIKAGTYYTPRGREFWYATKKGCLVLELKNESYKRIVLSIDGNKQWAERINKAISTHQKKEIKG